jgi:AAA family ATP:ADP antiporter
LGISHMGSSMQNPLVQRLFRIQPGEGNLWFVLGLILLGNSIALQISGIASVSGFLSSGGVNQFLLVLLIDYTFILLVGGAQSLIVDKFDRVKLLAWASVGFAVLFVILRLLFIFHVPEPVIYLLMYLTTEQQFIFFPLVLWVLANDALSMAQTKRIFPLISSWGFVGKLMGIGIAFFSPAWFASLGILTENILLLNVTIYISIFLLITFGLRNLSIRKTLDPHGSVKQTLMEGWGFIKEVPSFRYLMLAILAIGLCDTIVEFRFLVVSNQFFPARMEFQGFYSIYRLVMTILSFLVQMLLSSWLIQKMELKRVFIILPVIAMAGAGLMIVAPGLPIAMLSFISLQVMRDTTDDSARKSFTSLVPEERRGRVSTFMSNYLPAVGTILACLITGAIVLTGLALGRDLHILYMIVALLAGAVAVGMIIRMSAVYESSLLSWRIKRRQRGQSSVLDKLDFK